VLVWECRGGGAAQWVERLQESFGQAPSREALCVVRSEEEFREALLNLRPDLDAVVLVPGSAADFVGLLDTAGHLLAGLCVIVCESGSRADIQELTRRLHPRLCVPSGGGVSEVAAVLSGLLDRCAPDGHCWRLLPQLPAGAYSVAATGGEGLPTVTEAGQAMGPAERLESVQVQVASAEAKHGGEPMAREIETLRSAAGSEHAGLFLTFLLAREPYGIQIMKVQEIIGMVPVTKVPRAPRFLRGVINLRGRVIPVVDLRVKFDIPVVEDTARTCIIVVQIGIGDREVTMGVIVDEVAEVADVTPEQIQPPPELGTSVNTDFLLGMAKTGEQVIMLLDICRVLAVDEIRTVRVAASQDVTAA
jgi:purine-binding chemotaxis protein CheW